MTFRDIFKKSVLENAQFLQGVSTESILSTIITVLLSLALGFLIYFLYRRSFRGVVYSESFAISLVGMTVLTCGIIVTIQSNVVLSLGMVGALSIVRYRTAIKSPMDLMFLFWTVAAGIAVGAQMFYIALVISLIMGLLLLLISRPGAQDAMYVMIVHYSGDDISMDVRRELGSLRYKIQSQTMRKQDVEMAIEIRVKQHNLAFVDAIRALPTVNDVTVVQYNGDYIG